MSGLARQVRVFAQGGAEGGELYQEAAERVTRVAAAAIEREGRAALLLSGGSTPRRLYALLAASAFRGRVDWTRTHLFWGDERAVPMSDPLSNYRMVSETLLSRVAVPEQNVHRIRAEIAPAEAAVQYEDALREFFGGPPRFHLALLGVGADGHTASLFPGSPLLQEARLWVAASELPAPGRITLTLPALNHSEEVLFLVTGAAKGPAVAAAIEGPPDPDLPAALVRPVSGRVTWLLDGAAGAFLREKHE